MKKILLLSFLTMVLAVVMSPTVVAAKVHPCDEGAVTFYDQQMRRNYPCSKYNQLSSAPRKEIVKGIPNAFTSRHEGRMVTLHGKVTASTKNYKKTAMSGLKKTGTRTKEYQARMRTGRGSNYVPVKYLNKRQLMGKLSLEGNDEVYSVVFGKMIPVSQMSKNRLVGNLRSDESLVKTFGKDNLDSLKAQLAELGIKPPKEKQTYERANYDWRRSRSAERIGKFYSAAGGKISQRIETTRDE